MEGGKGKQLALPPPAASISAVFSNDDLLREILVHVGFPTFLVRAALVSERWLRHAADPAFLRRFRALHPPHLLGFYVAGVGAQRQLFLPFSQAPELAAAVNRCKFDDSFGESSRVVDCRNGRRLLFERSNNTSRYAVWGPLRPAPTMDGADGIIIAVLTISGLKVSAEVYVPQSGVWVVHATAGTLVPRAAAPIGFVVTKAHGRHYMVSKGLFGPKSGYIFGLDLATMSIFVVKVPDSVRVIGRTTVKLFCGEDSGLFLVYGEGSQLSVWHRRNHSDATSDWILVDTITVREACNRCENVLVLAVGDNAEFVFVGLEASRVFICVDMRSRTENVFDVPIECDMRYLSIMPYMMVWPPVFPALNENHEQGE
ncbi:hypothetical protein ACP70R_039842 [Stipagrostis hirtigluma subsp. patula]